MDLHSFKNRLDKIKPEHIKFKKHFHDRVEARQITESAVFELIQKKDKLLAVDEQERQGDLVYRLRFFMSSKYTMVVVVKFIGEDLYILTAWKTSKRWQRGIQR